MVDARERGRNALVLAARAHLVVVAPVLRESGPNLLAGKLILVEQIGGNVAHVT